MSKASKITSEVRLNFANKKDKKPKKIFILHAVVYPSEFIEVLSSAKLTVLRFKPEEKHKLASVHMFDNAKAEYIFIKKFGQKFGNPSVPTPFDYIYYTINAFWYLPNILKNDAVVFIGPPFFDCTIIPILKLFKKETYLILMDAQKEVALNFNKKMGIVRKTYYFFAEMLENYSVRNATKVFPVSRFLEKKYLKLNKNTYLIPNGANVKHIESIKPKRISKEFTITCLSSFEKYRGMDLLIEAYKLFREKNKNSKTKLLLIGGGPDFESTKALAANDKDIIFTGYLPYDQAIALCKGSDLLVMPALDVLASRTISSAKTFAYIACNVPIVVTDTGDHAYFVDMTKSGVLVKATKESVSDGIDKLFNDKKLYRTLIENSKKNKQMIDYMTFKKILRDEILC